MPERWLDGTPVAWDVLKRRGDDDRRGRQPPPRPGRADAHVAGPGRDRCLVCVRIDPGRDVDDPGNEQGTVTSAVTSTSQRRGTATGPCAPVNPPRTSSCRAAPAFFCFDMISPSTAGLGSWPIYPVAPAWCAPQRVKSLLLYGPWNLAVSRMRRCAALRLWPYRAPFTLTSGHRPLGSRTVADGSVRQRRLGEKSPLVA